MRLNRSLFAGLTLLALAPTVGRAQEGRLFNNSWFWGLGGGTLTYWTSTTAHSQAPTVSLDWLITRTHWALYLGADQSFFSANNLTYTEVGRLYTDSTLTNFNNVSYYAQAHVRNSRHIQGALMAFPGHGILRPYAGLGISGNFGTDAVFAVVPAILPGHLPLAGVRVGVAAGDRRSPGAAQPLLDLRAGQAVPNGRTAVSAAILHRPGVLHAAGRYPDQRIDGDWEFLRRAIGAAVSGVGE